MDYKKYIKSDPEYIVIESAELRAVMAALDKTMKEIEKKKAVAANTLISFKKMQDRIENILKMPVQGRTVKEKKAISDLLENILKG